MIEALENKLDAPHFLTEVNPGIKRRLMPGYSSARRIVLNTFTDDELERAGIDSENINHSPWFDDLSLIWDVSLMASYSFLAYQAFDKLTNF